MGHFAVWKDFSNLQVILFAAFISAAAADTTPITTKQYPLRLQTELDSVNVDSYMKNERLFQLQLKCLMDEGPCDIVGRWVKPRLVGGLLGGCPVCTPIQEKKIEKLFQDVQRDRPQIFRMLFVKFIENAGIKVDQDKKDEIAQGIDKTIEVEDMKTRDTPTEYADETTTLKN